MSFFVVVKNNRAELRTLNGLVTTFGNDVQTAVIQDKNIVIITNTGRTQIYQISQSGKSVVGPLRTF